MIKLNNAVKAASRKEALAIVKGLMEGIDPVDTADIERLYRYFLPAIPKVSKTGEQWVAKAIGDDKDVGRPFFQYLHAAKGRLVATDGNRLHYVEFHSTGFFDPKSMHPVKTGLTYPDIDRVIPSSRRDDFISYKLDDLEKETTVFLGKDIIICNIDGHWYSYTYIADAANGKDFQAQVTSANTLFIKSEFGYAVVMAFNKVRH